VSARMHTVDHIPSCDVMRSTLALILAVATATSGCGLVFTRGPSGRPMPGAPPPDCTTSKAAVYGDTVVTGAAMGTALFLLIAAAAEEGDRAEGETNQAAMASLYTFLGGVGFSISGIVGGLRVKRCRRAHGEWRMMQGGPPPGYPPQGYPPPGYPPPPPPPPR
jgi:hypothetical protein